MTTKAKTKRVRVRPANDAQNISVQSWYYENRGKLELYIAGEDDRGPSIASVKIPWAMLIASAKRCRPEEFTREALGLAGRRGSK